MKRRAKWVIGILFVFLAGCAIGAFYVGYYFGQRYAGERIKGRIFVDGTPANDGDLFETIYGDYIVTFGESQYWVRREGESWNVGAVPGPLNFCGDRIYSRSVPLFGVFPPQAKTDPWDPKLALNINHRTEKGSIEFTGVRSEKVKVDFSLQ